LPAHIDCATASKQQQPKRLSSLSCARQCELLAREHRPGCPDRVKRIVLSLQPPFVSRATARLDNQLAAAAQKASKPGTIRTGTLDCPDPDGRGVLFCEPQRLRITTSRRADRPPRNNRTARRGHDRQHMLVSMRVDTNHESNLICKHPV